MTRRGSEPRTPEETLGLAHAEWSRVGAEGVATGGEGRGGTTGGIGTGCGFGALRAGGFRCFGGVFFFRFGLRWCFTT